MLHRPVIYELHGGEGEFHAGVQIHCLIRHGGEGVLFTALPQGANVDATRLLFPNAFWRERPSINMELIEWRKHLSTLPVKNLIRHTPALSVSTAATAVPLYRSINLSEIFIFAMHIPSGPLPLFNCDLDNNTTSRLQRNAGSLLEQQPVPTNTIPFADAMWPGPCGRPLQKDLLQKLARKNFHEGSGAPPASYPINTAFSQTDRAHNADEKALFKSFARFRHFPEIERKAEIDRCLARRWQPEKDGYQEIAYLLPNMESFEVELARRLFHDPEAYQAVDAAIVRLRDVLIELHPGVPLDTIEKTFFNDSTEYANVGVGIMTLDELRAHANLRMSIVAFLNASFRWGNKFDLCQSVSQIARSPDWKSRIENAGLNVERISIARERLLASGDSDMSGPHIYFHPEAHGVLAELSAMREGRQNRAKEDAERLRWRHIDYDRNGMPVQRLEYLHLRRKSNDTITLTDRDGQIHKVNPMGWALLPPGAEGPEYPLSWAAGLDQRDVNFDTRWGEVMRERKHPVISGPSASTAIFLTMFKWLNVPGVPDAHFLRALYSWMRTPPGHTLYEVMRGAQMADPHLFRGNDKLQLFGDGPNSLGASQELLNEVAAQAETNPAAAKVIAEARRQV